MPYLYHNLIFNNYENSNESTEKPANKILESMGADLNLKRIKLIDHVYHLI